MFGGNAGGKSSWVFNTILLKNIGVDMSYPREIECPCGKMADRLGSTDYGTYFWCKECGSICWDFAEEGYHKWTSPKSMGK